MTPIRIGLDIAKNVFQAHGVDDKGTVVIRKRLRRPDILPFFASLPPCRIGIEACSASHHWARELIRLGHDVRLMPAATSSRTCNVARAMLSMRKRFAKLSVARRC